VVAAAGSAKAPETRVEVVAASPGPWAPTGPVKVAAGAEVAAEVAEAAPGVWVSAAPEREARLTASGPEPAR
jgi:hypothetical protein